MPDAGAPYIHVFLHFHSELVFRRLRCSGHDSPGRAACAWSSASRKQALQNALGKRAHAILEAHGSAKNS